MGTNFEIFIGITICVIIIIGIVLTFMLYDRNRKVTLGPNLIDFAKAIENKNVREINRLRSRIENNPFLEMENLRFVMTLLAEYKKKYKPSKYSLEKVEGAIITRQYN